MIRRRHGGPPPTAEHLANLRSMSFDALAAYTAAHPFPGGGWDALLKNMARKGIRRDTAKCSVCGGAPHPSNSAAICADCLRERKNQEDWLRRFHAREVRRAQRRPAK